MRLVLLASILLHIYAAVTLWHRARAVTSGRGAARYVSTKARRGHQRSYASFTLRWGGVVIGLFVIYHILHLTTNTIAPGGASASPYERRSEEHTSELQSRGHLVCRLLLEKQNQLTSCQDRHLCR